jgi:hypothetical protein
MTCPPSKREKENCGIPMRTKDGVLRRIRSGAVSSLWWLIPQVTNLQCLNTSFSSTQSLQRKLQREEITKRASKEQWKGIRCRSQRESSIGIHDPKERNFVVFTKSSFKPGTHSIRLRDEKLFWAWSKPGVDYSGSGFGGSDPHAF